MPLVGDVILDARTSVPDPPQTLPPPSSQVSFTAVSGSEPLPSGSLYLQASFTNPFGETICGPESLVTLNGSQVIEASGSLGWASGIKVYLGTASGAEQAFVSSSVLPFTISGGSMGGNPAGSVPGFPPIHSSAWLPDTDGTFVPAYLAFRWLNKALAEAAKTSGGIPDMTGAPSVASGNVYTIPGNWIRFSDAWYDGYEITRGTRSDNWYQSAVSSLAWNAVVSQWANAARLELFPQAQRSAGQGTLSSPAATSDGLMSVTFAASPSFVVPVGLALVGTLGGAAGTFEIVSYTSFSTTQLTGLARGLGGTPPSAWPSGTSVYELNIRLSGYRYPASYAVGQSGSVLDVPMEWVAPVTDFLASQFKKAEHEYDEAKRLGDSFYAVMRAYGAQNNKRTGPKQMGGNPGILVYNPTPFHGVVIR